MNKNKKNRNWVTVGYPESLPTDWLEKIGELHVPTAISPLHDKDVDGLGNPKKPHYHVIFSFDGPTTYNNVKNICDEIGLVNPQECCSLRGTYRYHLHLDDPDKHQYDDRDRILLGGFDPASVDSLTKTEVDKFIQEILNFIEDNNILEYRDLIFNLRDYPNMCLVACTHTILFNTFSKSKRHKFLNEVEKDKKRKEVD